MLKTEEFKAKLCYDWRAFNPEEYVSYPAVHNTGFVLLTHNKEFGEKNLEHSCSLQNSPTIKSEGEIRIYSHIPTSEQNSTTMISCLYISLPEFFLEEIPTQFSKNPEINLREKINKTLLGHLFLPKDIDVSLESMNSRDKEYCIASSILNSTAGRIEKQAPKVKQLLEWVETQIR